jgi:DNA-binding winged helix-turn-helix (wHTH) protein
VLLLLLQQPGEIVTREEIVAKVWGPMTFWTRTTAFGAQSATFDTF